MKILNCEAVIFDLDGTLYDKKRIALYSMLKQWKTLYILNHSNKIRRELKGIDFNNRENYFNSFFSRIAEKTSRSAKYIEEWYTQSFYRGFIEILKRRYRAQNDLNNLLQAAKGKIPLAVFSDYSYVDERLEALDIDRSFFKVTAGSEDFGVLKPSARPLLHIASQLGVPAEKILVVGDRHDTDGKAAEMAGMMFYYIDGAAGWDMFLKDMFNFLKERG
jgi:putative hydrolase of the HAD superfamily